MNNKLSTSDKLTIQAITSDVFSWISLYNNKVQSIDPILSIMILPYLSMSYDGILKFLEVKKLKNGILCDTQYRSIIERIRICVKLFDNNTIESYLSNFRRIHEIHLERFSIQNRKRFFLAKLFGWDYDLGIFTYKNHYVANTYLIEWFISSNDQKVPFVLNTESSREMSVIQGKFFGSLASQLGITLDMITEPNINPLPIQNSDTHFTRFFSGRFCNQDLYVKLILFNVMNMINILQFYLGDIFVLCNHLSIRMRYICYYHSINTIELVQQYLHKQSQLDNSCKRRFRNLLSKQKRSLIKSRFRNCMAHYSLMDYLDDIAIDNNNFMDLLIQQQFNMSVESFSLKLSEIMNSMSVELEAWFYDSSPRS